MQKTLPLVINATVFLGLLDGFGKTSEPITNSIGMKLVPIPSGSFVMGQEGPTSDTTYLSFLDDPKDLSAWERGAPAPQCLSELLERQSGAGAPRSRERRTSYLQDLVSYHLFKFSG